MGVFGLVLSAPGATLTLNPTADTTLFETSPDNNMGATRTLVVGSTAKGRFSRALLKFDLGANLPPGSEITSASLRFEVTKAPPARVDSTFELRRMLVPWAEGNKGNITGAPASPGETTWRARVVPTTLWGLPGGGEGSDYLATNSGSVAVAGNGTYTVSATTNLLADVRFWFENPNANHGWLLISRAEAASLTARRIASREDAANAPSLVIEFTPPELRIAFIEVAQTNATVAWSGGLPPFQVQRKTSLSETNCRTPDIRSGISQFLRSSAFFRLRRCGPKTVRFFKAVSQ